MSPTAATATAKNGTKGVVYDMTSDTATIPTDDMFDLMKTASRGDDVFAVGNMHAINLQQSNNNAFFFFAPAFVAAMYM